MQPNRTYPDGAQVEVLREKTGEWINGDVLGFAERDGEWKYLVQLAGYMACSPDDPHSWISAKDIRPV